MVLENKEQIHPQENRDRQIVNTLLEGNPTNFNLAELARLRIRYRGFPGAKDIQQKLEKILQQWDLTEEALYEKTRQLHALGQVYKTGSKPDQEDWS